MKTRMYVDGFNLFHRLLKKQPAGYKWLDLPALGEHISGNEIDLVRYFTASIKPHPGRSQNSFNIQRANQEALLNAYRADPKIEIHYGLFQLRDKTGVPVNKNTRKRLQICSSIPSHIKTCIASSDTMTIQTFEEKKTDVNIASYLLKDAYEKNVDQIIIITNDSDLYTPLKICKEDLGITIIAVNPITNKSKKHSRRNQLQNVATSCFEFRSSTIAKFQMPVTITNPKQTIQKPTDW